MVSSIYYYLGTNMKLTEESQMIMKDRFRRPKLREFDMTRISRLLNRQFKSALQDLGRGMLRQLFYELERVLKTREKKEWASCFCAVALICICIEEAQISMDAVAMHISLHGAEKDIPSVETKLETCRKLDDVLFKHLLDLFHGYYKSNNTSKGNNGKCGFNPIRDGTENNGLDRDSAELVTEIWHIICSQSKCNSFCREEDC